MQGRRDEMIDKPPSRDTYMYISDISDHRMCHAALTVGFFMSYIRFVIHGHPMLLLK